MLSPNTTPETQYYGQPATRHRKMLTFLFTDVEGSTRLWEQHPQAMLAALAHHNDVLAGAIETHQGSVFKTLGDGFCAVFDSAHDALAAAVEAQQALCSAGTQAIRLNVRMGLHSGPAEERDNDYFGPTLNRVARLMGAANGGQILISSATMAHLRGVLPPTVELRDMGKHRLRDINEPEHIFQVAAPNLPGVFPPINSLSPRPTNLPGQLTSFVGREREVHEICSRLRQPEVRLLTLLGPGGIGKTRLSIQVGNSLRDEYTDGVFMVALSPVRQADSVIDAVAQVLKVEETGDTTLIEAVKAALRDRHLLLILDNFEQVIDAAPLVNDLLAAAPRLKIIVTSREELLIYGEQLYTLAPLTLPEAQHPADVMKSSAAALFIERVRAAQPEFTLDETTAPHIAEICQRLDGLPLAIELASVRTRDLSLEEIAQQLGNRLQTLSSGPRDLPARQRTMRGAIEWSYHLLSAEEQHAFAQLGIFSGQFTVEAADAIIGAQNLNRLKEKSLIRQVTADDQFVTFEMLETLREYAIECLTGFDEYAPLQRRHAAYYLQLTETAEPNLTGDSQIEWFTRLDIEQYNLQAALEWMLAAGETEQAGRMTGILWRFWGAASQLSAGSRWIAQVMDHASALPDPIHAKVTQGAGRLAFLQNRFDQALRYLHTSQSLFRQHGDHHAQAAVCLNLGEIMLAQGRNLEAEEFFHTSLALYETAGDQAGVARCLNQLGRLAIREKNLLTAAMLFQCSLDLTREHGSAESTAMVINDLAEVLRTQGQYEEAAALYRESLALYRELGFDIGVAVILHNLGQIARKTGSHAEALSAFREALGLLQDMEEKQIIAECLAGLGGVFVETGDIQRAAWFLGSAKALLETDGIQLDYTDQVEYEQTLRQARATFSAPAWNTLWAEGQTMPLWQVIATALHTAQ